MLLLLYKNNGDLTYEIWRYDSSGGVMLNGRQIYDDATVEIQALEEKLRLEYELPIDFYIG